MVLSKLGLSHVWKLTTPSAILRILLSGGDDAMDCPHCQSKNIAKIKRKTVLGYTQYCCGGSVKTQSTITYSRSQPRAVKRHEMAVNWLN